MGRTSRGESLIDFLRDRSSKWKAEEVFGPAAKSGAVYRWGVGVATGGQCDPLTEVLSHRIGCQGHQEAVAANRLESIGTGMVRADGSGGSN